MKKTILYLLPIIAGLTIGNGPASAAYVLSIDTDGATGNGITFNPNFSFGGDTTSGSTSTAFSAAIGLPLGDSLFGGNGVNSPDTYVYSYTPGTDGDNVSLLAGTALNANGDQASGEVAGGSGLYNIYATYPASANVSGGLVTFNLVAGATTLFSVQIDQVTSGSNLGNGNQWVFLGSAALDAATTYELQQIAGSNTFVSMRASGVLFDAQVSAVPEPSMAVVLGMAGVGAWWRTNQGRKARR